jgi:glycosyltransferase involved in cell wall biosynthesis/GT2 family glycosyltransferase
MGKPRTDAETHSKDAAGQVRETGTPGAGEGSRANDARPTPDLTKVLKAATDFRTVGPDPYAETLRKLREVVWRKLPLGASALVVSKGDKRLLTLYGPRTSHFPHKADGSYLGYYPPDGTAVIAHLEALRARGWDYLVFPKSALWWLESYPRFAAYLRLRYRLVVHDPEVCAIFALKQPALLDGSAWRAALLRVVEERAAETGVEPAVLDWNTGLDLKQVLPNRMVFSPPTQDSLPPYLDRSIDIVVVLSPDEDALSEARRVAAHAVAVLEPDRSTAGDEQFRLAVEHVDHGSARTLPTTSIVIRAHSGWEQLARCLRSLEETLPDPFDGEVIVVYDGVGDGAALNEFERLESRLRLKVVRNKDSRGSMESGNRGAAEANGEIIVFLSEWALPQFGWFSALQSLIAADHTTGAVTGRLLGPEGRLLEAGSIVYSDASMATIGSGEYGPDDPLYCFVREVDFCSPSLFATRRKVFEEVGGLSGPLGYENIDYCFALRARGYKVRYQPECTAVQLEIPTGDGEVSDGTTKYEEANRAAFVEKWKEALRGQPEAPKDGTSRSAGYRSTSRVTGRAVVCAPLLPEFDREGGSRRIYCLIEFLRESGWDVSFVSENPRGDDRYVRILQQLGVAVYRGFSTGTDELFRFGNLDVAFFAFWHLAEEHMGKLRQISPSTKVMIDAIDLHWLRNARKYFLQFSTGSGFVQESGAAARDPAEKNSDFTAEMIRELKTYLQVDAVLTPSDKEAEMIRDLLGNRSLAHTVRDHEPAIASTIPFQDRRGILFVANFNHPPNRDAVVFFCEEILPKIDRDLLREHPLSIVGHRPPPEILRYAKESPLVRVYGWVPSVVPYLQSARVTVVPMRYGAGTKRKLLQALMANTPTVTTSVGIEGMSVVPGRHVLLAEGPARFARATERLLTDPELWASLRDRGAEHVCKLHAREAVKQQLLEVLAARSGRKSRA